MFGNLSFEFWETFEPQLLNIDLFTRMSRLVEIVYTHKTTDVADKEFGKLFSMYNWYIHIVAHDVEDFPMNLASASFSYYLALLNCILPVGAPTTVLKVERELKNIISFCLQGIHCIIDRKESNQFEFLGCTDLLKCTIAIINECMTDTSEY